MKKILISLVFLLSTWTITDAGVVPGTIQKWISSTSLSCSTTTTSYITSNGCTTAGQCKPYSCSPYSCSPYSCNCKTVWTWTWAVTTCWTCYQTCYKTCYESWWQSYWSSSTSFNNYHNNSTTISYNGSVKLTSDTQTCNPRTTWVSSSSQYWGYTSCNAWSCWSWWAGSWYNWVHWYCSSATSVKTVISSFDQLWNRTYSFNNSETTQYNSSKNVNLTATCQIEWRYATSDTTAPTASINGVWNVFVSDDTKWCNIEKYRWEWYTYKADENPGCEFYKGKNTHIGVWQWDLLKWLEITVPSDPSGIWEVQVVLWKCSYTYTPDTTTLSNILVSTTSPSGVKSTYKDAFTLRYNTAVTALWKSQPSLLTAFWKARLDECLEEWKNSIAILIKDMAVSETDGKTASPNTWSKFTAWTINIDNSTSKLQLSWDLTTTSLVAGTTIAWVTWQDIWRNYTIGWNVKAGEIYKWWKENKCSSFSGSLTWQCSGTLSWGRIWIAPSGVQADGKFMQFKCDNLGPFPDNSECQMWCPNGQTWNPNTNSCWVTTNLCKAFVWWAEVVIEDGVNGVVSGSTCMAYCIPWHSVWCVVKGAPSPTCSITNAWDIITIFNNLYGRDPECDGYNFYKNLFDSNPSAYSNISCRYKTVEWGTAKRIINGVGIDDCTTYLSKFGFNAPSTTCGWSVSQFSPYSQWCNTTIPEVKYIASWQRCDWGQLVVTSDHWQNTWSIQDKNKCLATGNIEIDNGVTHPDSNWFIRTCHTMLYNGTKTTSQSEPFSAPYNNTSLNCNTLPPSSSWWPAVVDGICGSANTSTIWTAPTSNLCASWTPSGVSGSGPWNWTCQWSGWWTDAICSANKTVAIVWVCWINNGQYIYWINNYPQTPDRFCSSWTLEMGTFSPYQYWWVCKWDNWQYATCGTLWEDPFWDSDRSLKKDIVPIDSAYSLIDKLEGVHFNWKDSGKKDIWFIAQDVQSILPELVRYDESRGVYQVSYQWIIPILVEAMKEQEKRHQEDINELKKQIEEIKQQLK